METTEKLQLLADLIKIRSVNDHELQVAQYLKGGSSIARGLRATSCP
ncbi:hypothetical protein [Levilactobacillus zymae]|nr:hypothetical protein [Levilactobacillus zymae]